MRRDLEGRRHPDLIARRIVFEAQRRDAADRDAAQLDRGADGEPMQRAGKGYLVEDAHRIGRIAGGFAVSVEHEARVGRALRGGHRGRRRLEGDRAGQQRLQCLGLDPQPLRADRGLDAGGDPELAARPDQRAVRIVNEDIDRDGAVLVRQRVVGHLADLDAVKINRRRVADERQLVGHQCVAPAVGQPLGRRRVVEAAEIARALLSFARQHADIGARQQGAEPGDAAQF